MLRHLTDGPLIIRILTHACSSSDPSTTSFWFLFVEVGKLLDELRLLTEREAAQFATVTPSVAANPTNPADVEFPEMIVADT